MSLRTTARDEELVRQIANYLDILASDAEGCARRGLRKKASTHEAAALRRAAQDIREIELI